jgi:pilus assembly protein CpaC
MIMFLNPRSLARRPFFPLFLAAVCGLLMGLLIPNRVTGQRILTEPEAAITLAKGTSGLIDYSGELTRVSVADPSVAEAVVLSPQEVLLNGIGLGSTSLFLWDSAGTRRLYSVEVTADVGALQRYLDLLFPDEQIEVSAQGNTVMVSGRVSDAFVARRAIELAQGTGAVILDNIETPAPKQILLEVRFAEVSRDALENLGNNLLRVINPQDLSLGGRWEGGTDSDGVLDLSLIGNGAELSTLIRALKTNGDFKSLAEPNLLALDGQEASFLAGGEFPFPSIQGGASNNAVTVQWREFGVRLTFTPTVTNIGNIRLSIAPEVSALDFAGGLSMGGFQIPSILTRKAETEVELQEGQHLAIAGLIDNSIQENIDKLPFLGSIPIIGALFRSRELRQERTELLVIVTPRVIRPSDAPIPVPTGEPADWDWKDHLKDPVSSPDTVRGGAGG